MGGFNGSGTMVYTHNWATDKAAGVKITASRMDTQFADVKTALELCLIRDGQNVMTGALDLNGNEIVLDVDGDTSITADSDDRIDIKIANTDAIQLGHDSTNSSAFLLIDPGAHTAQANTAYARVHIDNDAAVTIPTGTTAVAASLRVEEPNLTATGTVTNAATVYIAAAPTEGGTGNFALWVDSGKAKFDGDVEIDGTATFNGSLSGGAATTTSSGLVELATNAEVATGTDTDRAVTPASLAAGYIAQGTHTIFVPAAAMTPTVSNGCAALAKTETTSGRPDMKTLDFDDAADEHAQFEVAFPASWDEGTITFRVFWTTTATDTDGVAWGLQGVACSDGDTIDVAYGTAVVVTDAGQSTAEDCYVTSVSGAVTIAGTPAAGDMTFFRIFRDVSDAADTMTEDARLLGVQLFYTVAARTD